MLTRVKELDVKEAFAIEGWVTKTERETRTKQPYYEVTIQTEVEELKSRVWNNSRWFNGFNQAEPKFYAYMEGVVESHHREKSETFIEITYIEPKEPVVKAQVDIPQYTQQLHQHLSGLTNETYHALAFQLFQYPDVMQKLFEAPASQYHAHNFKGGLLFHIVRLMDLVDSLAPIFSTNPYLEFTPRPLDTELLKLTALYHDLGKMDSYAFDQGKIELTDEGKTLNVAYLSAKRLWQALADVKQTQSVAPELEHAIEFCVTAAKGDTQYGALNNPATKESFVFNKIRGIESELSQFETLERTQGAEGGFVSRFGKKVWIPSQTEETKQDTLVTLETAQHYNEQHGESSVASTLPTFPTQVIDSIQPLLDSDETSTVELETPFDEWAGEPRDALVVETESTENMESPIYLTLPSDLDLSQTLPFSEKIPTKPLGQLQQA